MGTELHTLKGHEDGIRAKQPLFGEGKKKDEFPGAFSLVALREWCESNDRRVYE